MATIEVFKTPINGPIPVGDLFNYFIVDSTIKEISFKAEIHPNKTEMCIRTVKESDDRTWTYDTKCNKQTLIYADPIRTFRVELP